MIVVSETMDVDLNISHLEIALLSALVVLVIDYRIEDDLGGGPAAVHKNVEEATVGEWNDASLLADNEGSIFEKEIDVFNVDASSGGVVRVEGVIICELGFSEGFKERTIWNEVLCREVISWVVERRGWC